MAGTLNSGDRWKARPRLAGLLRVLLLVGPLAVSIPVGWLGSRLLPLTPGVAGRVLHTLGVLAISTVALVLADRLARRLVPLATLLQLTLLFPDQAPSRIAVARSAIRGLPVEEHLRRVARAGEDPGAVAREIISLVAALDGHDRPTRGHAERVRLFTDLLAEELRLPRSTRDRLRWASLLHDVGKLTVPAEILNKPGKPDAAEWELLKAHPIRGREIAAPLLPWLGEAGLVIAEHHERWDGTGYPSGLSGEEIGICSRIVSVADAFDVMTAARAYRRPVSRAAALDELVKCAGGQFDPVVVRAMVGISAPRLRRVQGFLGWLADVPFLATSSVPAGAVARAVGAGALAVAAPVATTPVGLEFLENGVGAGRRVAAQGAPAGSPSASGAAAAPAAGTQGSAPADGVGGHAPVGPGPEPALASPHAGPNVAGSGAAGATPTPNPTSSRTTGVPTPGPTDLAIPLPIGTVSLPPPPALPIETPSLPVPSLPLPTLPIATPTLPLPLPTEIPPLPLP